MFKQWIIKAIVGIALLLTVTGYGIVADKLGLDVTHQTYACEDPGHSGGGC